MRAWAILSGCLIGASCAAAACTASDDSCEGLNECGTAASGGSGGSSATGGTSGTSGQGGTSGGGAGGSAGDGGTCDDTKSPSEEACLVDEAFAVFVSPSGADGAAGTKAAPLKSITEAATVAGGNKIVIVCNGAYDEHVKLTGGAKVYGGFDCSTWAYQSGTKPDVAPATAGYALEIDTVSAEVVIEDVAFMAKEGVAAGESSIGAFVKSSTNVSLSRVKLEAGKGVKGDDGLLAPFTMPQTSVLNGNAATGTQGAAAKIYGACPGGGTTTGGTGGNAPLGGGGPGLPDHGGGQPGVAGSCGSGGTGKDGNAAPAASASAGATKRGTLSAAGFAPEPGGSGAPGGPGQGGGGGAADANGGGGSGGAGGCGGAGGPGGKGGGASIALLVFESTIAISSSELVSADAGDGGKGAAGQSGMANGGNGGFPDASGGCQGGKGGGGGAGAPGGGGAGGISVGVAYQGPIAPTVDAQTTFALGGFGAAGVGGNPGGNDGILGVAQNVLEVAP